MNEPEPELEVDEDDFKPLTDPELARAKLPELRDAYVQLRARHGILVSRSLQDLKSQGRYTGGQPPYGYELGEDGTTLVEVPKEQAVIRRAVELRAMGYSLRAIAATLNAERKRSRRRTKFHQPQIKRMLNQAEAAKAAGPA